MFKSIAIITLVASLAAPAAASDDIAKRLGLPPGEFTLNELVQIMYSDPDEKKVRIELIRKKHAVFAAAVAAARMPVLSTTSTSR